MIAKAAKNAVLPAIGTSIGACVLPRMLFRGLYGSAWPPVWKEALLFFVSGYIAAFSVLMLIYRLRAARHMRNRPSGRDGGSEAVKSRALFDSELPVNVDWDQVNAFLKTTAFYKELLRDDWQASEAFIACPVSHASMECLRCLHEDLAGCYQGAFAFYEDGRENRHEEYRLLREHLQRKYPSLDADVLKRIYLHYLQEDSW